MKVINATKGVVLCDKAVMAHTLLARVKGLLGRVTLARGEALILMPCNSVHTFFMRFSIDVVFVSSSGKVVGIASNLVPWRLSKIYFGAHFVIEFPAGTVQSVSLSKGDILQI